MITFSTTGSTKRVSRRLQNLMNRQIPYAASKALNATGNVLLAVNKREMKRNFDNPVPYTINAFYMKPARYNNLRMSVRRKDKPAGKHYLDIQHKGGVRPKKGVETLFKYSLPYKGIVGSVLPTKHSMTRAGGISMARVNEVIGQIGGTTPQSSYTKSKSRAAADRLAARKRPVQYFIGYKEDGKNKTDGIYRKEGKRVKKMFHILSYSPRYRSRFPFYQPLMNKSKFYFPRKMRIEMRNAMRTARF